MYCVHRSCYYLKTNPKWENICIFCQKCVVKAILCSLHKIRKNWGLWVKWKSLHETLALCLRFSTIFCLHQGTPNSHRWTHLISWEVEVTCQYFTPSNPHRKKHNYIYHNPSQNQTLVNYFVVNELCKAWEITVHLIKKEKSPHLHWGLEELWPSVSLWRSSLSLSLPLIFLAMTSIAIIFHRFQNGVASLFKMYCHMPCTDIEFSWVFMTYLCSASVSLCLRLVYLT